MLPEPFVSTDAFRCAFAAGLAGLLREQDDPDLYLLVLANAGFNPALSRRLDGDLQTAYGRLAANGVTAGAPGSRMAEIHHLIRFLPPGRLAGPPAVRRRELGPWELQFNPLRSLRPNAIPEVTATGIAAPSDPSTFNFNMLFLDREIIWEGRLCGRNLALFYNKYPFVPLHALAVPEHHNYLPQFLRQEDHAYLWRLTEGLSQTLPDLGFGYNSYGACASINHLHFQMFQRRKPLPVADPCWRHNGGSRAYPARCLRFHSADESWRFLERLHRQETSYNLIYLPGRLYCLPRAKQGSYLPAPWSSGCAWYEMAGGFIAFTEEDFRRLEAGDLEAELARTARMP